MKTDHKLLELAAKAAGLSGTFSYFSAKLGWRFVLSETGVSWNPLEDDGDALRLAVKLKLDVLWAEHEDKVVVTNDSHTRPVLDAAELCGNDHYAATRRAIVRTAAMIGEMK